MSKLVLQSFFSSLRLYAMSFEQFAELLLRKPHAMGAAVEVLVRGCVHG